MIQTADVVRMMDAVDVADRSWRERDYVQPPGGGAYIPDERAATLSILADAVEDAGDSHTAAALRLIADSGVWPQILAIGYGSAYAWTLPSSAGKPASERARLERRLIEASPSRKVVYLESRSSPCRAILWLADVLRGVPSDVAKDQLEGYKRKMP